MNADDWKSLAIPGEYDAMDATDQGRWRGVIEQAYALGRRAGMTEAAGFHKDRAADLEKDKLDYMVNDMRECLSSCLRYIDLHLVCAAAIEKARDK